MIGNGLKYAPIVTSRHAAKGFGDFLTTRQRVLDAFAGPVQDGCTFDLPGGNGI
jgi:hypothetical protein